MPIYAPEPPPQSVDPELQEYLARELSRIGTSIDRAEAVVLTATNVAPTKPEEGTIIYADGVNFNPGLGEGVYAYINGAWIKMSPTLGSAAAKELTNWVAYTPTLTGFGTPTAVSIESRRVGDTLSIRGKFTSGIATAVEARMTLGFNGTNGGITSDATKVSSIQMAGACGLGGNVAINSLIESNIGYITFARGDIAGMTKANANTFISTGVVLSVMAEVPISGW